MKTKYRGLLSIAAVAALSLTACSGGSDEPAAAAPAASKSSSATESTAVPANAESSGIDTENYLIGSWSCKTTGDDENPSIFGLPSSAQALPSEITFQSDEQWVGPEGSTPWDWSQIDDTLLIEIDEWSHFLLDIPGAIQIPSTVPVTSYLLNPYAGGVSLKASNTILFETDKMTMKVAEFTDPNEAPAVDSGATVTCSK